MFTPIRVIRKAVVVVSSVKGINLISFASFFEANRARADGRKASGERLRKRGYAIINARARTMIWSCFPALQAFDAIAGVTYAARYVTSHCYASRGHTSNFIDTLLGSGGCSTSDHKNEQMIRQLFQ